MKQHGKIQVGDIILDAEIEYEIAKISHDDAEIAEMFRRNAQRIVKFFNIPPVINGFDAKTVEGTIEKTYGKSPVETVQEYMDKYPTWTNTMEGSIVEPITDETRLLD
jgi:hypothetical protein